MADASAYVTSLSLVGLLGPGPPPYPDAPETVSADSWALGWADVAVLNPDATLPAPPTEVGGGGDWRYRPKPARPRPQPPTLPPSPAPRHAHGAPRAQRQCSEGGAHVAVRARGVGRLHAVACATKVRAIARGRGVPQHAAPALAGHAAAVARGRGAPWQWEHFVVGKARAMVVAHGAAVAVRNGTLGVGSVDWSALIAAEDELLERIEEASIYADS